MFFGFNIVCRKPNDELCYTYCVNCGAIGLVLWYTLRSVVAQRKPCFDVPVLRIRIFDIFSQSPSKHQENVTRSEEMAALVLTALSISPVLKEQENCKLKFFGCYCFSKIISSAL